MNRANLERYAQLKKDIKALEAECEALNPQILQEISLTGADKIESDFGTFSLGARKTWTFHDGVLLLRRQLEEQETLAKQTGTASFVEKKYLIYKEL